MTPFSRYFRTCIVYAAFILLSFVLLPGCGHKQSKTSEVHQEDSTITHAPPEADSFSTVSIQNILTDTILQLPEVKELEAEIEETSHGQRGVKLMIEEATDAAGRARYWIKVCEDNGTNYVPHLSFIAYPDTKKLLFYDVAEDRELSLEQWRKSR